MSANYDNNTLHMNFGDENQNEKKPKKGKKIIITVLIIVLALLIVAAGVVFLLPKINNGGQNNNGITGGDTNSVVDETITAKKFNNNLYYVYDSPYSPQNPQDGYFIGNDYYDVSDLVVPYINIDSPSATEVNNKIHTFYDEAVTRFNEYASNKNAYIKVGYKYYLNKNVLSIVIERIEGGNSVPQNTYLTCNYDLVQNKILNFADVYKIGNFSDTSIDPTIKYEIENSSFYKIYGSLFNEETLAASKAATNEDYTNRKNTDDFNYFIDSKGNLVVDINYIITNNGSLKRLLTINKSNEQQPTPERPETNTVETNSVETNTVETNTVEQNVVEPNGVPEQRGVVDANGNLDLSSYEGIYACYFSGTTAIKTEVKFYKENDKWYMDFANRNSYSDDDSGKVTLLPKNELGVNNGNVTFKAPSTTFVGIITFSQEEISIKVDQAALNTNVAPSTITLNVKSNTEMLLATNIED